MTVGELIKKLSAINPERPVWICSVNGPEDLDDSQAAPMLHVDDTWMDQGWEEKGPVPITLAVRLGEICPFSCDKCYRKDK